MKIRSVTILAAGLLLCLAPVSASAKTPKSFICANAQGALTIRTKCKKKETKQTLASLTGTVTQNLQAVPGPQGPKGAQGPKGPVGPKGNAGPKGVTGPTGFVDFSLCYTKLSTILPSTITSTASLTCNSTASEFMLNHSFALSPFDSTTIKPFVNVEQLQFDGTTPVGVSYTFNVSPAGKTFSHQISLVCCPRV